MRALSLSLSHTLSRSLIFSWALSLRRFLSLALSLSVFHSLSVASEIRSTFCSFLRLTNLKAAAYRPCTTGCYPRKHELRFGVKNTKYCIKVQQFHLHDRQLPYNARVEVRNAINSFIIINFKGITHFLEFEVFYVDFLWRSLHNNLNFVYLPKVKTICSRSPQFWAYKSAIK